MHNQRLHVQQVNTSRDIEAEAWRRRVREDRKKQVASVFLEICLERKVNKFHEGL